MLKSNVSNFGWTYWKLVLSAQNSYYFKEEKYNSLIKQ